MGDELQLVLRLLFKKMIYETRSPNMRSSTTACHLAASDGEELLGSIDDPALPQFGESSEPKPGTDGEHFRVLSRAVD